MYFPTGERGGAGAMFCSSAATLAFTMLWLVSLYGAAASVAVMFGFGAPLPDAGPPTVTPALDCDAESCTRPLQWGVRHGSDPTKVVN